MLLRVSQVVRNRLNDWLDPFELNDGRYGVLSALSQSKKLSQSELAEILGQSASNVSTLIERMARDGLVTRFQSDTDRRKRLLTVTSEGLARLASVETKRAAWAAELFDQIDLDEQPRLLDLWQRFESSLETETTVNRSNRTTQTTLRPAAPLEERDRMVDPSSDPHSPQFALQQMLLALSSTADIDLRDERVVA